MMAAVCAHHGGTHTYREQRQPRVCTPTRVGAGVTCDRIENTLDQGLEKILRFALNIPGKDNRTRLLKAFLKELRRRMELEEVSVDTISQLGVFASL